MAEDVKLHLPIDAAARNEYPMWDGLFAYFPASLAEMARLSKIGNDQHNPGEHMHWAREKSRDHKNKILKHMLDTGPVDAPVYDTDGVLHSVKMAWRACAFAQEQLEALGRPHGENAAPATEPVPLVEPLSAEPVKVTGAPCSDCRQEITCRHYRLCAFAIRA